MNISPATKVPVSRQAWKVAILAGMASYLDAGAIITNGATIVLYNCSPSARWSVAASATGLAAARSSP